MQVIYRQLINSLNQCCLNEFMYISYIGELESFLSELGIDFSANHDYFGANIKKLVTETFVKQLYLKREKVTDNVSSDVR